MFGIENYAGSLNDSKESLSFSAFQTVVRHAFGSCEPVDRMTDSLGIDARCAFNVEIDGFQTLVFLNVQLKGTSKKLEKTTRNGRECWHLSLNKASLANYRRQTNCPLFLALVLFPHDEEYESWFKVERESSTLLNQIYRVPMSEAGGAETTAYIPLENRLTQETLLQKIVFPLAKGARFDDEF